MVMNANDSNGGGDGFDDFAHAAGAALRQPAPDNGLARVRSARQRHRMARVAAASGAVAIVIVAGALLVNENQDDSQRLMPADRSLPVDGKRTENAPEATPPWSPPGTEFVSSDLGPATMVFGGPAVAALTRQVGIEGHPPIQVISTSMSYGGHANAFEQVCTSENGGSACRPEWVTPSWSTGTTSSVANGESTFDLWTIEGLPADTAFVTYTDGDLELWQRPIMGFVAFPNVPGEEELVVAYAVDGTEIGRFGTDEQTAAATLVAEPEPPQADLSPSEFADLSELTFATLRDCLTTRGGTLTGDVATFAPGVDQVGVWEQCVTETKQIVGDAVTELDPRFYDPVTERPQNEDPAQQSVSVDFTNTDIALDADGWQRTSFTPDDLGFVGPEALGEAQFSDGTGRYLQVNLYPGGTDGFIVRTQGDYPPLPPEDILTLDEFEQVASYPSDDRFRYDLLLDDATVLEIAGAGFEDVESFLETVALVVTSTDQ
jgi:hypothetical protein